MIRFYKTQPDMSFKNILTQAYTQNKPICLVKIETTGLDPLKDEICGIRSIKFALTKNGAKELERFACVVKTNVPISDTASEISGITNVMIQKGMNLKDALLKLNQFVDSGYICGFNTKNFIYPFLFAGFKKNHIKFNAIGGFDIVTMAKTVIPPNEYGAGYGLKDLRQLFKAPNNMGGIMKVFKELYNRVPKTNNKVPNGYVLKSKFIDKPDNKCIVFSTIDGLILLNCNTLYFEDYESVFDKIDMDSFLEYVLSKTKTGTLNELAIKLQHAI